MASSQLIKLSQAVIMLFMLRREEAGVMRAGRRIGLGWRGTSDTGTAFGHRTCGRALHCIMQRVREKKRGGVGCIRRQGRNGEGLLTSGCCGQSSWAKLYEMVVSVKFLREEVMMFCSITEVEVVVVVFV